MRISRLCNRLPTIPRPPFVSEAETQRYLMTGKLPPPYIPTPPPPPPQATNPPPPSSGGTSAGGGAAPSAVNTAAIASRNAVNTARSIVSTGRAVGGGAVRSAAHTLVPGYGEAEAIVSSGAHHALAAQASATGSRVVSAITSRAAAAAPAAYSSAATAVTAVVAGVAITAATAYIAGGEVADVVERDVSEATGSRVVGIGAGTLSSVATGVAVGAAIGSVVPGLGTTAGAIIGGGAALVSGLVRSIW